MSTLKNVAIASLVGAVLVTGTSFAAPAKMEAQADKTAKTVAMQVNKGAAISCNQAALTIASAANSQRGALKGAAARNAIAQATTASAEKASIATNCVTPTLAYNAASKLTGFSAAKPALLGKVGGAGLLGGAGALGGGSAAAGGLAAAFGGSSLLLGAAAIAATVATVAVVNEINDDDDCVSNCS